MVWGIDGWYSLTECPYHRHFQPFAQRFTMPVIWADRWRHQRTVVHPNICGMTQPVSLGARHPACGSIFFWSTGTVLQGSASLLGLLVTATSIRHNHAHLDCKACWILFCACHNHVGICWRPHTYKHTNHGLFLHCGTQPSGWGIPFPIMVLFQMHPSVNGHRSNTDLSGGYDTFVSSKAKTLFMAITDSEERVSAVGFGWPTLTQMLTCTTDT